MNFKISKPNAIVIANKPFGLGSNKLLSEFKKLLPKKTKVGFVGTLDPLANGVLPIAVGKFTKLIPYMKLEPKVYQAEFVFGVTSETLDLEGVDLSAELEKLVENKQWFTKEQLESFLQSLIPEYNQVPPVFSAKKVNGVRSFKLAREGKAVELAPCKVGFSDFEILDFNWPVLKLKIQVGKGFYVRSLVKDIASEFATVGLMSKLTRVRCGKFVLASEKFREIDLRSVLDASVIEVAKEVANDLKYGKLSVLSEDLTAGLNLLCFEKQYLAVVERVGDEVSLIRNFV